MMKRVCTICARGGSKGVKNKNLRLLAGKPLIAHSIEQALKSNIFQAIAVSSDSKEILEAAKLYGATILVQRPAELATDTAPKLPVIKHCFTEAEKAFGSQFDLLVDLDCTSPLRNVDDIIQSAKRIEDDKMATNLITAMPARRSPWFNMVKMADGYVQLVNQGQNVTRRQDAPQCFDMNASIYVWRREHLLSSEKVISDRTLLYEMPEERSIDIDSNLDFEFVKFMMENKWNDSV